MLLLVLILPAWAEVLVQLQFSSRSGMFLVPPLTLPRHPCVLRHVWSFSLDAYECSVEKALVQLDAICPFADSLGCG